MKGERADLIIIDDPSAVTRATIALLETDAMMRAAIPIVVNLSPMVDTGRRMSIAAAVERLVLAPLDDIAEPRFHRDRTHPRSPKARFRKGRG